MNQLFCLIYINTTVSKILLFDAPVVDGSNFTNSIEQNIGNLRVQGVEFSLNADVK